MSKQKTVICFVNTEQTFKKPQLALDNISKIMDFYDRFKDKENYLDIELVESVDNEEGITINKLLELLPFPKTPMHHSP